MGVLLLGSIVVGQAAAGERRYHLVSDGSPNVSMKPVPGYGPPCPPPRPTCQICYTHPYTGRVVTVPLQLPDDTPKIHHRISRVVYDYGSDTVTVIFLPDGTVDVVYNTGFLRGL
jgi:hypothetical protein